MLMINGCFAKIIEPLSNVVWEGEGSKDANICQLLIEVMTGPLHLDFNFIDIVGVPKSSMVSKSVSGSVTVVVLWAII